MRTDLSERQKLIKEIREKLKMTQSEFAQKMFLTQQSISYYETGKREPHRVCVEQAKRVFEENNRETKTIEELKNERTVV